jgi:hypothetical protein
MAGKASRNKVYDPQDLVLDGMERRAKPPKEDRRTSKNGDLDISGKSLWPRTTTSEGWEKPQGYDVDDSKGGKEIIRINRAKCERRSGERNTAVK